MQYIKYSMYYIENIVYLAKPEVENRNRINEESYNLEPPKMNGKNIYFNSRLSFKHREYENVTDLSASSRKIKIK